MIQFGKLSNLDQFCTLYSNFEYQCSPSASTKMRLSNQTVLKKCAKMGLTKSRLFRSKSSPEEYVQRDCPRVPVKSFHSLDHTLPDNREREVDQVIEYLLENLNCFGDLVNSFSGKKALFEQQLSNIDRSLSSLKEDIIVSCGESTLPLIESYFDKMLNMCIKQVHQQIDHARLQDIQDELNITQQTIEYFDSRQHQSVQVGKKNSFLRKLFGRRNKCHSLNALNIPAILSCEIVEKMHMKLKKTCQLLTVAQDQLKHSQEELAADRFKLDHFCQSNLYKLRQIMPHCKDFFKLRLSKFLVENKILNVHVKVRQCRHQYALTMRDLQLLSDMLRQ